MKQAITPAANWHSSSANQWGCRPGTYTRHFHTEINHLVTKLEELDGRKLCQSDKFSGRCRGKESKKVCPHRLYDNDEGEGNQKSRQFPRPGRPR